MSKRWIKSGSADQTIDVFIQDSTSTTGAGLTGLAHNTSGLTCYYRKGATGTPTALTLATQTVGGAHSDGGFVAVDGTNMPGVYRLDLSDTIVASAGMVTLFLRGAANMVPLPLEIEVVAADIYDATRLGLTALPNAAAEASGGLITRGTGTGQLSVTGGLASANTTQLAGQTVTAAAGVTFPATVSSLTAGGVRTELATELGRIDASISSRMATYTQPTGFLAATFPTTVASTTNITSASGVTLAAVTHTGAVIPRVTLVDTTTTNSDMRGTDGAALASVWTSTRGGYLDSVVLAANANQRTVQITGSQHIAADVHEFQAGVITAGDFAAGAIDAAALATDAVTEIAGVVLTTAMTESYRAAGVAPTLAQTAFELLAHMGDSAISGTTKTLKKIDGTTAKTFTLDSATTPTSITEAT